MKIVSLCTASRFVPVDYINIAPHVVTDQIGMTSSSAQVVTYSRGGLKLSDIATGPNLMRQARQRWANNVPSVTLLCAGACDINNSYLGAMPLSELRTGYPLYVEMQLENFLYNTRRLTQDVETYDRRVRNHRFVVCEHANWGVDYEPRTNIDPVEYRANVH